MPDIWTGEISLIINGQMTEVAPHPHPTNSLPNSNAHILKTVFQRAPMMMMKSTKSKENLRPNDNKGLILKAPTIAPKGTIVVTTELKVSWSSKYCIL